MSNATELIPKMRAIIENIDMCLDFCKLKYRPNQDPPIVVIDLYGLASTLKKKYKQA
jgi:hypothetical protein